MRDLIRARRAILIRAVPARGSSATACAMAPINQAATEVANAVDTLDTTTVGIAKGIVAAAIAAVAVGSSERDRVPNLGIGIGLRPVHFREIFSEWPQIDWFEVISENFMGRAGRPLHNLERILERYPVVLHGVTLSIGGAHPLDFGYLKRLKALAAKTKTPWISDHLCWGKLAGVSLAVWSGTCSTAPTPNSTFSTSRTPRRSARNSAFGLRMIPTSHLRSAAM